MEKKRRGRERIKGEGALKEKGHAISDSAEILA